MADNSEKSDQMCAEMCDSGNNDADNEKRQDEQAKEDGTITLKGCGVVTKWTFGADKKCPVIRCKERFDNRADAIAHYTARHSTKAIVCHICDRPICTSRQRDYVRHYKVRHPNEKIPFDFPTKQKMVTYSHHSYIYTKRSLVAI